MPTILKTKNSVTTTVVPTTLQQGELAVNITDKKLWVGNAATTPVQLLGTGADGSLSTLTVGAGTVSAPAITTTGDTNTGIFFPAADTIAFTEGGTESMRIDSSGNIGINTSSPAAGFKLDVHGNLATGGQIATGRGVSTGDCSIEVGEYRTDNGNTFVDLHSSVGVDYDARILRNAGVNGELYLINKGTGALNLSQENAAPIIFVINNSERMRIASDGNVGIGTSSPQAKLHVSGTTTRPIIQATNTAGNADIKYQSTNRTYVVGVNTGGAAGEFAFYDDTAGAERMRLNSGGGLSIGTTTASPTNGILLPANGVLNTDGGTLYSTSIAGSTTAAGANMYVDATNGFIQRSTSSIKYKTNVEDLQQSISENIYKMRPVWYRSKGELDNKDWSYYGLIAEEVAEIEPRLVHWSQKDENGKQEPEGLMYDRLTVLLLAEMKKQQAIITDLTNRLTALEQA
jgi:hypothetical protein